MISFYPVKLVMIGRGDDTVGNPHGAQVSKFELFELILIIEIRQTAACRGIQRQQYLSQQYPPPLLLRPHYNPVEPRPRHGPVDTPPAAFTLLVKLALRPR